MKPLKLQPLPQGDMLSERITVDKREVGGEAESAAGQIFKYPRTILAEALR